MAPVETAHLTKGSTIPPKQEGKLRLYSMTFCPYAERVRIVLEAKNVPYDIVNVDLKEKPDWLFELNPDGKVPVLDIGGKILIESLDISDYLDEAYPEPPLRSKDPKARARDDELITKFDGLTAIARDILYSPKRKTLSEYANIALPLLKDYEKELVKRGNYFGGDAPGIVDYMIWPWAERAPVMDLLYKQKLPIAEKEIPHIRAWCERMRTLEPVKQTITSVDRLHKFTQLTPLGKAFDYDSI